MIRYEDLVKEMHDFMNAYMKRYMKVLYKNESVEQRHLLGLVTKTTLTSNGIEEDEGGIKLVIL